MPISFLLFLYIHLCSYSGDLHGWSEVIFVNQLVHVEDVHVFGVLNHPCSWCSQLFMYVIYSIILSCTGCNVHDVHKGHVHVHGVFHHHVHVNYVLNRMSSLSHLFVTLTLCPRCTLSLCSWIMIFSIKFMNMMFPIILFMYRYCCLWQ